MNCRDTERMIDTFFDGELEGRLMRDAAMHITRCKRCEVELQDREQIHELLARAIDDEVAQIDLGQIWQGVSAQIAEDDAAAASAGAREGTSGGWLRLAALSSRTSGVLLGGADQGDEGLVASGWRRPSARRGARRWTVAGAAAIAASLLLAVALFRGGSPEAPQIAQTAQPPAPARSEPIALARASASQVKVESIDYSGRSMAMWSEPETDTTVIWLDDGAGANRR